ncbi:hypothetical protein [Romboutsia sp. Marseille-P6047]|uniref:hypothetical protein n=1 Tax=Romboutsia sp. Marseille-P6047 TaxID=2161817 RepID=UPI000F04D26D|nr:hypothetical protein [Romboutsia sp. Marseille-P6047]
MEFFTTNWNDLITIVLALATIVISVVLGKKGFFLTKKSTEITLNKDFFEKIFFDFIIVKLPESLTKLEATSENGSVICDEVNEIINSILTKAVFYKYFDEDFYNKLLEVCTKLDEELVTAADDRLRSHTFIKHRTEIVRLINELYKILKDHYSKF